MKRVKLIASLCMLALTICSLAFGVYAAISTNFTAAGSITFSAYNIKADFEVVISGLKPNNNGANGDGVKTIYASTKQPASGTTTNGWGNSGSWQFVDKNNSLSLGSSALEFDELNSISESDLKIRLLFKVYNYSEFAIDVTTKINGIPGLKINNNPQNTAVTLATPVIAKNNGQDVSSLCFDITPNSVGNGTGTQNISISVNANYVKVVNVSNQTQNCSSSNSITEIKEGAPFVTTLSANSGYTLPSAITVKTGNLTLIQGADYSYDSSSGILNIFENKIIDTLQIIAVAEKLQTYSLVLSYYYESDPYGGTTYIKVGSAPTSSNDYWYSAKEGFVNGHSQQDFNAVTKVYVWGIGLYHEGAQEYDWYPQDAAYMWEFYSTWEDYIELTINKNGGLRLVTFGFPG